MDSQRKLALLAGSAAVVLLLAQFYNRRKRDAEGVEAYDVTVDVDEGKGKATTTVQHIRTKESYSFGKGWAAGTPYPPFVTPERLQWLQKTVALRQGDVIVATFAKCGTTWLEQILLLLVARGDAGALDPVHKNAYSAARGRGKVWLEAALSADGGRAFEAGEARPACASGYYHAFNPHERGWPFAAWASAWAAGAVPSGSWFEWTREWRDGEDWDRADRLWIHYEDMLDDPVDAVARVARLLWPDEALDRKLIETVAEKAGFSAMRAQIAAQDDDWAAGRGHMRKGKVGDWQNHFSPRLADDFDLLYHRHFKRTGLVYDQGSAELLSAY
ncbi:sulfotransferase [Aureococcus anophagefferens]|nr:sulfotransferase [Aureococcus anophagefferens]